MTKDKVTSNGRRRAVAILMLVAMMFSVFGAATPERAFAADGTITLEELGIRHIVNLLFEDEEEEDEVDCCECGSSCEDCDECANEYEAFDEEDEECEGELCGIAFNFDIGNVNINGTITMIEDDEDDEEDEAGE